MVSNQESLQVGDVYLRNLVDEDGNVLLAAGTEVTEEFLNGLLGEGRRVVRVAAQNPEPELYKEKTRRECVRYLEDSAEMVEDLGDEILAGREVALKEVDSTIEEALALVQSDYCALLSSAIKDLGTSPGKRAVKLSSLAMVVAQEMNYSHRMCMAVGRAGLLCDVALPNDEKPLHQVQPGTTEYDQRLSDYIQHPVRGREMLQYGIPGISQLELVIVAQSHEQCDGSGFPRELRKQLLHPLSRLLNTIDAFLTLTDPDDPESQYMPSDAFAYLVQHALYGAFDLDCVRALVSCAAIYPIGTEVIFEDASVAEVIRSEGKNYMEPIVLFENETRPVSLRHRRLRILAPIDEQDRWRRLRKSTLNQTLWHRAG